jgi:hypothetical protein
MSGFLGRNFAGTSDQLPARLDSSLGVDLSNRGIAKLFGRIHVATVARGTLIACATSVMPLPAERMVRTIGRSAARPSAEFLNLPLWCRPANATLCRKKCIQARRAHEGIRVGDS